MGCASRTLLAVRCRRLLAVARGVSLGVACWRGYQAELHHPTNRRRRRYLSVLSVGRPRFLAPPYLLQIEMALPYNPPRLKNPDP